jgi:hypothetical protein
MEDLPQPPPPPPPPPDDGTAPELPSQWVEDSVETELVELIHDAFGSTTDNKALELFEARVRSAHARLKGSARRTGTACTVLAVDIDKFPSDLLYPDVGQTFESLTALSLALGMHEQSINVIRSRLRKADKDSDELTVKGVTIQIL